MRLPNLNALKMFDAAAQHLNFRAAAEELNLTQGAVAQQVRALEADLKVRLFDRLPRGLALTDIGADYHVQIRKALTLVRDATQKLHPDTHRITLSVTPSLASKWLVPRLPYLVERHPEIEINTVASETLANFRADGIDVAVRQASPPFDSGLVAEKLSDLDLRAVCSPGYGVRSLNMAKLANLTDVTFIQDSHRHWDALFAATGHQVPTSVAKFNQTALAMDAAANGQGVAIAPRLLTASALKEGSLVEVWRDSAHRTDGYYVVWRNADSANAGARQKVIDWLLSQE